MDPITMAILGALAHLGESVIKDAYDALKVAIAQKCGVNSDVTKSIENLEKKPNSAGRKETLREEIALTKVDKDPNVLKSAENLLEKLKSFPGEQQIIQQTVIGNGNIFSGTGDVKVTNK
jgi:hypothetical protein